MSPSPSMRTSFLYWDTIAMKRKENDLNYDYCVQFNSFDSNVYGWIESSEHLPIFRFSFDYCLFLLVVYPRYCRRQRRRCCCRLSFARSLVLIAFVDVVPKVLQVFNFIIQCKALALSNQLYLSSTSPIQWVKPKQAEEEEKNSINIFFLGPIHCTAQRIEFSEAFNVDGIRCYMFFFSLGYTHT